MNGVLIIPTGIGCELGGHAGDANPLAKLVAECCDLLITHPNVVNASDINEMTTNTWYVEGSTLDRFLEGKVSLMGNMYSPNKILLVTNSPAAGETINAVSAARVTIGCDVEILELDQSLIMTSHMDGKRASGKVFGWRELIDQVKDYDFDALAIHTPIQVDRDIALNYYQTEGGVNPWGAVEAIASKLIATALNKPVAHAPVENTDRNDEDLYFAFDQPVDPRIAPEAVSIAYLHCILKGLSHAPNIVNPGSGLSRNDVDFLLSPIGCWGQPHKACEAAGIPIIMVKENANVMNEPPHHDAIIVENYWEAVGLIMSFRTGIHPGSVRRPFPATKIYKSKKPRK